MKGTVSSAANTDMMAQAAGRAKGKEKVKAKVSPHGAARKRKKKNGMNKQKTGTEVAKKSAGRSKTFVKSTLKITTLARSQSTQEPQFA